MGTEVSRLRKVGREDKRLKTIVTFDDGGHWSLIKAPSVDHEGKKVKCDVSDIKSCSLHLHSVTQPHNCGRVFSTPAPGFVMGVGTVGSSLLPYDECDTFLSTDAGISWRMLEDRAMKYELGDQGSVIVMLEDEESTNEVKYSFDRGKTWFEFDLGVKMHTGLLTTVPDSTSLKFLLLGTLTHRSKDIQLDGAHRMRPTFGAMTASGRNAAYEAIKLFDSYQIEDGKVVGYASAAKKLTA